MSPDLDKLLCERYPEIFADRHKSMKETAMCWGFDCGDGWFTLIDSLCSQIQHHLKYNAKPGTEQVVAMQVKEKFGTLRFYVSGGDEVTSNFIWFAECFSGRMCEICGAPAQPTKVGTWITTRCEIHNESAN